MITCSEAAQAELEAAIAAAIIFCTFSKRVRKNERERRISPKDRKLFFSAQKSNRKFLTSFVMSFV
jgi:hypothetical protein